MKGKAVEGKSLLFVKMNETTSALAERAIQWVGWVG
jgi:hypothetical protein